MPQRSGTVVLLRPNSEVSSLRSRASLTPPQRTSQPGLHLPGTLLRPTLPILNLPRLLVTIESKSSSLAATNLSRWLLSPPTHTHTPGCSHVKLNPRRQRCSGWKHRVQNHPGSWGDVWKQQWDATLAGGPQTQRLESICRTPECSSNKAKESYMFYSLAPSHFFSYQKQLRKQVKALEQPGSRNPGKSHQPPGGWGGN